MNTYVIGADIGGTTVKLGLFDSGETLLEKWEIPTRTEHGGGAILPDIAASIREKLAEKAIGHRQVLGIGICVPGPVDEHCVVNKCVNLGWGVFNIASELSALTGFPVKAGNDANVATLGEYWKGGGQGCNNMIFATLGTGVGGGIVVEGQLLYGAHGSGAEIGHVVLNRNETAVCGCGKRGCAEQYCSATGVVRLAGLHGMHGVSCKDVFDGAKAGDPVALAVMEEYYEYLGEFLGSLCSVIDPEVVVLGGGVSKAGEMLITGMEPYFHKYVFHAASGTRFALASLGNDAGAYGAFKLALDAFGK